MKTHMTNGNAKAILWAMLLLTLVFASKGYADPLAITVLDSHYTTMVYERHQVPTATNFVGYYFVDYTRNQAVAVPISDALYDGKGFCVVSANAGLLETSAQTLYRNQYLPSLDPFHTGGNAIATSILRFSPLLSQTANLTLDISVSWEYIWTSGNATLLDITSGEKLWDYQWRIKNHTGLTVPFVFHQPTATEHTTATPTFRSRPILTCHTFTS